MTQDKKSLARQMVQEYRTRLGHQGVPLSDDVVDMVFHMLESWDPLMADTILYLIIERRVAAGHPTPITRPEPLEG